MIINPRFALVLVTSAIAVSCPVDTTEDILATINVPAGAMGLNGILRVTTEWTLTNSANLKTLKIHFSGIGGTAYLNNGFTAGNSYVRDQREIKNRNAANSQCGTAGAATAGGWGNNAGALTTSAVDTSAATTVVVTGQKATAGETLTLESYLVELLLPGST